MSDIAGFLANKHNLLSILYILLGLVILLGAWTVYLAFVAAAWGRVAASARAVERVLRRGR